MSLNVMISAENNQNDGLMLKPLVKRMLQQIGQPNARVQMCPRPYVTGVANILKEDVLQEIIESNPLADLHLLVVDRDGEQGREAVVAARETFAQPFLRDRQGFLGTLARQEIEVWLLGGHPAFGMPWADVRAERDPKEVYFEPFARERQIHLGPGGGRQALAKEMVARYPRVCQLCTEVQGLQDRIATWLAGRP